MKLLGIVILLTALTVIMADDGRIHHDGKPGCTTDEEVRVQKWRNNWDPTIYWICKAKNQAATVEKCPTALLFFDPEKRCIDNFDWYWTPPQEPPSRP